MHVQYECHRRAIIIPWEKVVKRLSPGSSGFAALQHLNKLRDILVSEGHLVPPLLGKKHVKQDPTIRGHIRDMDSDSPIATRIVRWDEVIEDRKQNLVVPGINRGSGNYPRTSTPTGVPHTIHSVTKPAEGRRSRIPAEEIAAKNAPATPVVKERKKPGPKLGSKNKPRVPKIPAPARSPSLDPAELASDDSYTPNVKTKGKYGLRKVTKKSTKEVDEESVATVDDNGAPIPLPSPASGHSKFAGIPLTPPASLSIKLLLRPELLARFPRGESKPAVNYESGSDAYEDTPDSDAYEDTLDSDAYEDTPDTEWDSDEYGDEDAAGSDEELQDPPQQMPSGRPSTFYEELLYAQYAPAAAEKIHSNRSYQGILEHGNQAEYKNSIRSGADPIVNGLDYKRARQHARKATESATQFLADGPDMISRKNIAHVAQHDVETDMVHGYDSQPTAPRIYGNYSEHEGTSSSIDESMEDRRQDRNAFFDTVLGGYGVSFAASKVQVDQNWLTYQ